MRWEYASPSCPILDRIQSACFSNTHAHTSQLGVCGWGFLRLSDRQKEEREEVENISQKDIQAIIVNGVVIADIVQLCYC